MIDSIWLGIAMVSGLTINPAWPRYVSHKKVWALQIKSVGGKTGNIEAPGRWLEFEKPDYAPLMAPEEMFARYTPTAGDYYVVYADGYRSFSPKKAFEEGYRLDEPPPTASDEGWNGGGAENRIRGDYKD